MPCCFTMCIRDHHLSSQLDFHTCFGVEIAIIFRFEWHFVGCWIVREGFEFLIHHPWKARPNPSLKGVNRFARRNLDIQISPSMILRDGVEICLPTSSCMFPVASIRGSDGLQGLAVFSFFVNSLSCFSRPSISAFLSFLISSFSR